MAKTGEVIIKLVNGELAGKTLQEINKSARDARVELSKAQVGTQAWVDASKKLDAAVKIQEDYKKQLDATSKASGILKQQFGGILNQIPGFSQLSGAFNSAKTSVGGLTSGFGMLKGAIAATGIGLLVLAVAALATWFSKTETGGDLLAKSLAALKNIFNQVIESVTRLLSGDIVGFFKGMTTEMAQTTKAAWDLADALDSLEEKESAFQVVQKAGLRDKAELLKITKEEGVALDDRVKAIDKAMQISKALNKQEIDFARERIRVILNNSTITDKALDAQIKKLEESGLSFENAKDYFKKGNLTQDDLNEANEALAKYLELQQNAFDDERELLTQRNKLTKKEQKEETKALSDESAERDKIRQAELKKLQEENDARDNLRKLANEKRLLEIENDKQRDIERLEQETQEKIINLQGSELQIAEQIAALKELQRLRLLEIDKKYNDIDAAERKKAQDQKDQEKADADAKELENARRLADGKRQLSEMELQTEFEVGTGVLRLATEFAARRAKDEALAKKIRKGGAIVEIGLNLQKELAGINANAALNPLNAVPGGTAIVQAQATVQRLLARGRAAIGIASVLAFRRGGLVQGPSHEQGGVPGVVRSTGQPIEFEGGEFFFSREAVKGFGVANLARMNNMFAAGGPVDPFISSRSAASSAGATGGSQGMPVDFSPLISEMQALRAEVRAWPSRLQVINDLTKTKKGLQTLNELKADADV